MRFDSASAKDGNGGGLVAEANAVATTTDEGVAWGPATIRAVTRVAPRLRLRDRRGGTTLRRRERAVAVAAAAAAGSTAGDAGQRQTRTFRHRAGDLIVGILTTVKAGAAAADMDDTIASGNANANGPRLLLLAAVAT